MCLSKRNTAWFVTIMVLVLLIIDQVIKIYVKTHFCLGESVRVTDWFFIEFVENNGMAWGMSFINKLTLSLFRLVAIFLGTWYVLRIIKRDSHSLMYVVFVAMILTGAIGNMLDSMFYGLCFTASSPYYVAYSVPFGEGYTDFLMGKVVDMFRFPFFTITWPEWIPLIGGSHFTFFDPVFNFADSCVTVGVLALLLFKRKELETLGQDFSDKYAKTEVNEDSQPTKEEQA